MNRLNIVLTLMTGSGFVRGLLTVVLSLGFYVWLPITFAVGAGLLLVWSAFYVISRRIKRDEPAPMPRTDTDRHRDADQPKRISET